MKNNVDISSLGGQILGRLSALSRLPESGFIAGGAVANTILSIIDGADYPANDIDVFSSSDPGDKADYDSVRETSSSVDEEYGRAFSYADRGYAIAGTTRDGLINHVTVFHLSDMRTLIDKARLEEGEHEAVTLAGFDINCTQVGIDIQTEKIYFTDHFKNFLDTRQVRVTNPSTPHHTACRIVKKQAELKCYMDIEYELSLLATFTAMRERCLGGIRPFGEKIKESFKQYSSVLAPYCSLVEMKEDWSPFGAMLASIPLWKLEFAPRLSKLPDMDKTLGDCLPWAVTPFMTAWDRLYRPTTRKVERNLLKTVIALGNHGLTVTMLTNPGYIPNNNFSAKKAGRLTKYAGEHSFTIVPLLGDTLDEQYAGVKILENAGTHGLLVTGLLENRTISKKDIPRPVSKEWIKQTAEKYLAENSGRLTSPLDISGLKLPAGTSLRELLSVADLAVEGQVMRHCVGGYASSVKDGHSRIFHIDCNGRSSTVEIRVHKNSIPHIVQHRGVRNTSVSAEESAVASRLEKHVRWEWFTSLTVGEAANVARHTYRRFKTLIINQTYRWRNLRNFRGLLQSTYEVFSSRGAQDPF